ncbi:hypothetical protein BC739_002489 [Kutzneria viridogrisea]|uniref:Aminoglycoside phosphotransferase domain-containing protein n=1 Tax=Kutzneria viridogrisea TaxID=47990 RepID=A0ABR6BES5_9PSEU|nr:hypothetical protein [Kutzneria viridogrisea]
MNLVLGHGGNRVRWSAVPERIRASVDSFLGSPVVSARSQPGGFSPALAARLSLADGRGAFVKAVGPEPNPDSAGFYRREAAISAALPAAAPVPRLLGSWELDGWVVLVFEEVDGRTPELPWRPDQLRRVLDALPRLWSALTPAPVQAPSTVDIMTEGFTGWAKVRPDERLDPWAARNLDRLADLAARGGAACAGHTLVHGDLRADNLLLTAEDVIFVDWPAAVLAAPWFDLLAFLPSVVLQGGPDPESVLAEHEVSRRVDPDRITAVLAGFTGYFVTGALRPPVPGLPQLREFQRLQGEVALRWLRRRLPGWR